MELLTDAGGVQLLLALPRNQHTHGGLGLALFALASLPLAFERVCALPRAVVRDMVACALALLTCNHDSVRIWGEEGVRVCVRNRCEGEGAVGGWGLWFMRLLVTIGGWWLSATSPLTSLPF